MGIKDYFNGLITKKIETINSINEYELEDDIIELGPTSLENMTIIRDLITADLPKFYTSIGIKNEDFYEVYLFPKMMRNDDKVVIEASYIDKFAIKNDDLDNKIKKLHLTTKNFIEKGPGIFPKREFYNFDKNTESIYLLKFKDSKEFIEKQNL